MTKLEFNFFCLNSFFSGIYIKYLTCLEYEEELILAN